MFRIVEAKVIVVSMPAAGTAPVPPVNGEEAWRTADSDLAAKLDAACKSVLGKSADGAKPGAAAGNALTKINAALRDAGTGVTLDTGSAAYKSGVGHGSNAWVISGNQYSKNVSVAAVNDTRCYPSVYVYVEEV